MLAAARKKGTAKGAIIGAVASRPKGTMSKTAKGGILHKKALLMIHQRGF